MRLVTDLINTSSNLTKISIFGETGEVTFAQCGDDFGVFKMDASKTTSVPNPIVVGQKYAFNFEGGISAPSAPFIVDKTHLHVLWNGTDLYEKDVDQNPEKRDSW